MKKTLLIFLSIALLFSPERHNQHKNKRSSFELRVPEALASTLLTGAATFSTDTDKANYVRYYYYSVNGAATGYSISNPSYLSQVNSFLDGVNSVMSEQGYSTCADIPTTGSFTAASNMGTFNGTFSNGTKTVPSSFPADAGSTYDKKISLSVSGSPFIEIQIKCTTSGTRVSGSILIGNQAITQGTMNEILFQKDDSTGSVYLDYVVWVNSNRKFATRFITTDGTTYRLYQLSLWDGNYNGVAISGTANGKTNFNILYTTGTSTTTYSKVVHDISGITNGGSEQAYNACIDMSTNSSTTGCPTIQSPGTLTINGTSYSFNFSSMSSLTTSSL